jgi:hypothetical protein
MRTLITIVMLMVPPIMVAPTSSNLLPKHLIKYEKVVINNMDLFLHDLGHQESENT